MEMKHIDEKIEYLNKTYNQLKQVSNRYSSIRIGLLLAIIFCLYQGYNVNVWYYYVMVAGMLLFIWFVRLHMDIKERIALQEVLIESYQDIKARKGDGWKQFKQQGDEYLSENYTQAYDLDLFGHASMFQYICVAKTQIGKDALAKSLACRMVNEEYISKRQESVQELVHKEDVHIKLVSLLKLFERHGRKKKKQTFDDFFAYMEDGKKCYPKFVHYIVTLISLCTIISIVLAFISSINYAVILLLAMISVAFAMLFVMKNNPAFQNVKIMESTLADYEKIFTCIVNTDVQSLELQIFHEQLKEAPKALGKLHRIMMFIQMRHDGIMFLILNGIFLLDFQCVFALESWKKRYGTQVREWFHALAYYEMILSLGELAYAKNTICYPKSNRGTTPYLLGKTMYHPLIDEKQVVSNDFEGGQGTFIITGSNMSGKTTFLRAIGLNMVLYHAGGPVCATMFCASRMSVFTSMRIHDNVSEGISTFYAEILRIKEMIMESQSGDAMLVLIDEIFKGTNSADRIICAKEVLRQLHLPHVMSMVSTHDFELCTLQFEKNEDVKNYHFREYFENENISFDYTLKSGRCKTTNAQELLKLAGISIDITK